MMSPRAVRATIGTLVLAPLATGPLAVLAQATAPVPQHTSDLLDTLLKIWSALSVLVIAALHLWVRSIVRDHTDAVSKAAADALKEHDENPSAHANHRNPQKYAVEIGEVRVTLGELKTQTAVILARIEAGQEAAAGRWDAMESRLDSVTAIEHRLAKIEGEHVAIHRLSNGPGGRS